jgi:Rps23 Pro-64 3,4-dihydroxylase Tpa1-like proline 4-hydroxylase
MEKLNGQVMEPSAALVRNRKGFSGRLERQQKASRQQAEVSEQITLTLLLTGGQQYQVNIAPDAPLLRELHHTLATANPEKRMLQVPIQDGKAALTFPSDRLVGFVTKPPLQLESIPTLPANSSALSYAQPKQPDQPKRNTELISDYLQVDNFLTDAEHQQLFDYTLARQPDFQPTTTFTGAANYRESVVLYSFPEFAELITRRVQAYLPQIYAKFNMTPFPISQIEAQLTAHNDGQFYKVHNDNGSPNTATRELTYVYYFYRNPKPFTGGELVVYDSKIQNNHYVKADTCKTVDPRNNSIVFFLSRYMHEVLPIQCPSRDFGDSRFTINGWIRR